MTTRLSADRATPGWRHGSGRSQGSWREPLRALRHPGCADCMPCSRSCLLPQGLRHAERIEARLRPPPRFVTNAMEFAMMNAAERHRELVADLAPERARLSKAQMMRVTGRPSANHAGLPRDELAVFLVAQADGFGSGRAADGVSRSRTAPGRGAGSAVSASGSGGSGIASDRTLSPAGSLAGASLNAESLAAKAASTTCASGTVSVFLVGRLRRAQCAASSAV